MGYLNQVAYGKCFVAKKIYIYTRLEKHLLTLILHCEILLKTIVCIFYSILSQQFPFNITHETLNLNSSIIHLHSQPHYLVTITTGHLDLAAQLNTTKSFFNGFPWLCFSFQIKPISLPDSLCLTRSDQCTQTQGTRTHASKQTHPESGETSVLLSLHLAHWEMDPIQTDMMGVSRNTAYAAFETFLVRNEYSSLIEWEVVNISKCGPGSLETFCYIKKNSTLWVPPHLSDSLFQYSLIPPRSIYLCQNRVRMTDRSETLKVMPALESHNEWQH